MFTIFVCFYSHYYLCFGFNDCYFRGVYLTDLTFVEGILDMIVRTLLFTLNSPEGNPDQTKNLINFGKRELVHNILAEIQQYQLTSYVFPLVDSILFSLSYFFSLLFFIFFLFFFPLSFLSF